MRPSPWQDAFAFLTAPSWPTPVFWLLLIASAVTALLAWRRDPAQRTGRSLAIWLLRVLVGAMWWQQSLWKVPPDFGGLIHWMQEMVDHASTTLQSSLVGGLVLPNIALFGPVVYAAEVLIAVSLILGLLSRAGAILGALMATNLWLGLYSAPGEWPWTYVFLIVIQLLFVVDPPGYCLGADAVLARSRRSAVTPADATER